MEHTFGGCFADCTNGQSQRLLCFFRVARSNRLSGGFDCALHSGTDRGIAHSTTLRLTVSLLRRLGIRHEGPAKYQPDRRPSRLAETSVLGWSVEKLLGLERELRELRTEESRRIHQQRRTNRSGFA